MKTRIISGICMVPLLIFVYLGGYWLTALAILIGAMGVHEFYRGFRVIGVHANEPMAFIFMFILYLMNGFWPGDYKLVAAWLVTVIMAGSVYMFNVQKRTPDDAMVTIIGILYIIFFSFHVTMIDETGAFSIFRWLILLTAFGTDIFAYFTGVFLGKHKMAPHLSPKKTWEGAIGGIIGCTLLCWGFGMIFCREFVGTCTIIGLLGAPVSMFGDLTASAYKRKMGIKDYGNLIPGHGGIMDRFDSILFTAPFVYYYTAIVLIHFHIIF